MEWTREQRYLPYDQHSALELLNLQRQAATSPEQLKYHIRPQSGLLNDPNGFSYFNNQWHVFYQSFPFGAAHGLKSWMHLVSDDLVHWQDQGLALAPDTEFDSHGAYSGTAKAVGDRLFLMYTGNHRDENWVRTPYQLGAWMDKSGHVEKLQAPLFVNPAYVSEHFRDPQIMEHDGKFYAIIGQQTVAEQHGQIALWTSDALEHGWHEVGKVNVSIDDLGYMVECPNLLFVDGHPVMVLCPQGMDHQTMAYDNIFPNTYITATGFDFDTATMINPQPMQNLDTGFDVYASQGFTAPDGKTYLISWVGLPDLSYPTDEQNWANCLSQVKELHLKDGQLYQTPVAAMRDLRQLDKSINLNGETTMIDPTFGQQGELQLTIAPDQTGTLHLAANDDRSQTIALHFDTEQGQLTLDRTKMAHPTATDYGTTRTIQLPAHQALNLDIFLDHSLIEVFVNGGAQVMTGRYFNDQSNQVATFNQPTQVTGTAWQLSAK